MQDIHFLAVKPLSVKTTRASCADAVILNVMRHNARELQAEVGIGSGSGIDASRVHLNVTMHGPATADGVASAARDAMREHGIVAPRKNATLGIEIVVSLPAGLAIDYLAYFRDAMAWAQQNYRVPLLSAIIHNDEKHPHLHLVLLPVRDGKLVGSELLGDRTTVKAMQKGFHEQVAKQYGLRMPSAKKRYSTAERASGMALLRTTLQTNASLTDSDIDALLVPHAKNPEPLLLALGLAIPAAPVKGSFVATMTRKVRAENPNRSFTKSPIGDFGTDTTPDLKAENEMSYALFRTSISTPNISPQSAGIQATNPQHLADGLLTSQHTRATTDQAAPTSASTTPDKRKLTAVNCQPATAPAPGRHVETASLADCGAGKLSEAHQAVHQLDTPEPGHAHHQPGAGLPSKTGYTPSAGGGALKTQQVDQQAGQADAHRRSHAGCRHPGPRRGMAPAAKEYQRHRDEDHPATSWDEQHGEFAPTTGPPPSAGRHQPRKTLSDHTKLNI